LAYEAADTELLSPDLAAGIRRVKGAKKLGMRAGPPHLSHVSPLRSRKLHAFPLGQLECQRLDTRAAQLFLDVVAKNAAHCCSTFVLAHFGHFT